MDTLLEQVARAQRKMIRNQYAFHLAWWACGAMAVAALAIATPKVLVIAALPAWWAAGWLVAACLAAFGGAAVTTYLHHASRHDAAVELDRRFALRERVASSLSLPESERASLVGRALVSDAARSVEKIDVGEGFPVRADRRAWLPVAPAVAAFALMTLVGDRGPAAANPASQAAQAADQVKKSTEELRKRLAERAAKAADREELEDAAKLLKQVSRGVEEVAKKPDTSRKEATLKLNDLAKQLEERKKQLGGAKAMEDRLSKLNNLGRGPAEKAAQAMKRGDFKRAIDEIRRLQDKLAAGSMSDADLQKLAEQMGKLKEQLRASLEAQQQAMEDLKEQIKRLQQQGDSAQADKLRQNLEQMQQQAQRNKPLQDLADKLGQAQQAMQRGDPQAAAEAMRQMGEQLRRMQQEIDEMEMLDGAMDQIEMAKQAMGCPECLGGFGGAPGQGDAEGPPGQGRGKGGGPRRDEQNPTSMRDSRVRQKPGAGNSVFGRQVDGPNVKGNVQQSLKQAMQPDAPADAQALDEQRLPRDRRDHAREYQRRLRQEL